VSGGCLEAQVASRAWWLTAAGPTVQRYSTIEEDGDLPYGSGCGGVVHLLLERRATAGPLLAAFEEAFDRRIPLTVATILEGEQIGRRALAGPQTGLDTGCSENFQPTDEHANTRLRDLAEMALTRNESIESRISINGSEINVWSNFRPARPGLWIFGAGDDAKPLLNLAKELGWYGCVADGRSQLVTRERFPLADEVSNLQIQDLPGIEIARPEPAFANLQPQDAAVILTHSFEQDARILVTLLALDKRLAYIGVLGPQRRTRELLVVVARLLGVPSSPASAYNAWIERRLSELHAPMGLDLGAESPEAIAFSILAEIQQFLNAGTALPLREVRNGAHTMLG